MKQLIYVFLFILPAIQVGAATFTITASGDWNNTSIWSITSGTDADGIPDADDDIIINSPFTVTLTSDDIVKSITSSWGTGVLTIAGSYTLTVTGDVTFQGSSTGLILGNGVNLQVGGALTINQSTLTVGDNVSISTIGNLSVTAGTFTAGDSMSLSVGGALTLTQSTTNFSTNTDISVTGSFTLDDTNIEIKNGSTLTVTGTTNSKNGASITVNDGGSATFNSTVTMDGSGTTVTVDAGGYIDINATLNLVTNNTFIINGTLETDYLTAAGGTQDITIGTGGILHVINDVLINSSGGSTTFHVNSSGDFLVSGAMTVGNSGVTYEVDGTLAVVGTLTGESYITGTGTILHGEEARAYISAVLPIELTYFNASSSGSTVLLTWQTASEENNDYFTIERSTDGINFENIKTLSGAGNSTTTINYSTTDNDPLTGISYYRLKQTDYNGAYSYSEIESVAFYGSLSDISFTVYPNPCITTSTITLSANGFSFNEQTLIQIFGLTGQLVYEQRGISSSEVIISQTLSQGIYFVKVKTNTISKSTKLIVE